MHVTAVKLGFVGVLAAGLALAQGIEPENAGVIEKWSSELLKTADRKLEAAEHAVRITEELKQQRSGTGDRQGNPTLDQRPNAYAEVLSRQAVVPRATEMASAIQRYAFPLTVLDIPSRGRANRESPYGIRQWESIIRQILKSEGIPPELVAVPRVESGFNPSAISPKGARGLWQLMPETARRFGLRVDAVADERIDPLRSTVAAISYLKDLYGRLRNWPLALAAYNAGLGRVVGAIERGAPNFTSMAARRLLPEETIRYVPLVLGTSDRMRFPTGAADQRGRFAGR